jgi:hypothetical protein
MIALPPPHWLDALLDVLAEYATAYAGNALQGRASANAAPELWQTANPPGQRRDTHDTA